jgi:DNA-directed RNA polymerase specialized sigma24 family protein
MPDAIEMRDPASGASTSSQPSPALSAVFAGDESAWRTFVAHYDPRLRAVARHATEATRPLTEDEIDDVLGDFWLAVVANDKRMLRAFDPRRGSDLLTWLTFHVARIAYEHVERAVREPEFVPLDQVPEISDPRPAPLTRLRSESGASTIDAAIRECVRSTVVAVVREELSTANRAREMAEADRPRSAAWWAERLGCSAESLVKRAKRGSLEYVKIGARYFFTKAQVEGSRRWQRAAQGAIHED